jgi:SpoVK/Ycf46/Vps4 family AAA+-type ATPase
MLMAKKQKAAKKPEIPKKIKSQLPDEEVAYRIVKLYFEEIARLGFKRTLDLDAIINAYFYALKRLMNKEIELETIEKVVKKTELELQKETKAKMFPSPQGEEIPLPPEKK